MARAKRIYFNNAVYHITIRGNNKQAVLRRDEDKVDFLQSLNKFKNRFRFKLHAFVLMDNHAHLVIGTCEHIKISKIMQAITLSYSVKFRKKYGYSGYVWQGRFRSNIIDEEAYIVVCIEYIHNNPIRAGLVRSARSYPWSSWRAYNNMKSVVERYIEVDKYKG